MTVPNSYGKEADIFLPTQSCRSSCSAADKEVHAMPWIEVTTRSLSSEMSTPDGGSTMLIKFVKLALAFSSFVTISFVGSTDLSGAVGPVGSGKLLWLAE